MAKEAVTIGRKKHILLPASDYKLTLHRKIINEWNNQWKIYTINHAKFYGNSQPDIPIKHGIQTPLPGKITTLFLRLTTKTCQTPEYVYRIGKKILFVLETNIVV